MPASVHRIAVPVHVALAHAKMKLACMVDGVRARLGAPWDNRGAMQRHGYAVAGVLLATGCGGGEGTRGTLSAGLGSAAATTAAGGTSDGGDSITTDGASTDDGSGDDAPASSTGTADSGIGDSGDDPWVPDPNGPAYLHADTWSTWWNDRTRCGAEVTFLEICEQRGEADCSQYASAVAACNPNTIINGQVGPEQQGNELCSRGMFPDVGGCVASQYEFDTLRYWWYGAEWQGNWPASTLKVFPAGADWTGGGELVALSNLPGLAQAAMSGIDNHGLSSGCAIPGATQGDAAYQTPFGAFAWVEVPTDQPVTIVAAAATNFGGQPFAGCNRGEATQQPWVTAPPQAQLGCVYVVDAQFEPGHHYMLRYGQLTELDAPSPPADVIEAFARPQVSVDVTGPDPCAL